jgi:predicted nucleic acid-binding protein
VRLVLDTTVLIDALRQRPAVARMRGHHAVGDELCTTAINVEEVVRGLRPSEEERTRLMFEGLIVLPLGVREGWQAGAWRRQFASEGVTLSQPDCLVAAAALTSGGRLVTGNPAHFPMSDVEVEHWPVGK